MLTVACEISPVKPRVKPLHEEDRHMTVKNFRQGRLIIEACMFVCATIAP